MKKNKNLLKEKATLLKEAAEPVMEALSDELLDEVSGAGNPFDKVPRVPTQPIDDGLREDS